MQQSLTDTVLTPLAASQQLGEMPCVKRSSGPDCRRTDDSKSHQVNCQRGDTGKYESEPGTPGSLSSALSMTLPAHRLSAFASSDQGTSTSRKHPLGVARHRADLGNLGLLPTWAGVEAEPPPAPPGSGHPACSPSRSPGDGCACSPCLQSDLGLCGQGQSPGTHCFVS